MHAFPRSSLLILHDNALAALIPSTLRDQVDALLDTHRIDDAALLVDQRRRKLEGNLTVDPDEAEELEYVYQVIGFKCFSETLFEDAGRNLFNGALDPRVLVSYYPDLRGGLFSDTDQVYVYAGVAERMPTDKTIDDLVRNYSPHLQPNIREAPAAVELRRVLGDAAREMLLVFLEKSRTRAKVEKRREDVRSEVVRVVDTVLGKLYAHFGRHQDLRTLLSEPNEAVLSEIEPSLQTLGLLSPLANLYQQRGEEEKLLELYSGCVEGIYSNPDIQDPLENIVALLESRKDRDRKQQIKWGLWMLRRGGVDRGMKLLIPSELPKRRDKDRSKDDLALLEQITDANADAGRRFLEYLVLTKRNMSPDLHTRLALSCVDDLLHCLQEESTEKLWRAKASSYASPRPSNSSQQPTSSSTEQHQPFSPQLQLPSPPPLLSRHRSQSQFPQPFFSYFASTTPDSISKRLRLKAVFMLSGSGVYDAKVVKERLRAGNSATRSEEVIEGEKGKGKGKGVNVLALESAILDGKLENHALALSALVHDLRDSSSAETYCTLGGEVVPAKLALSIAESTTSSSPPTRSASSELGLREWYFGLFELPPQPKRGVKVTMGDGAPVAVVRQKSVKEDVKKALFTDLMGVYMRNAAFEMEHATRLLDSQGVNLDVVDVVTLVPDQWPLTSLNTFFTRYFRRTLHTSYENLILKNLSAAENLAVRESSWPILRDAGYVIEEPDSEGEDEDGVVPKEEEMVDEKLAYVVEEVVEKIVSRTGSEDGGGDVKEEKISVLPQQPEPEPGLELESESESVVERDDVVPGEERSVLGLILDGGGGEPERELGEVGDVGEGEDEGESPNGDDEES